MGGSLPGFFSVDRSGTILLIFKLSVRAVFCAAGGPRPGSWGTLVRDYFPATGFHSLEPFLTFYILLVGFLFLFSARPGLRLPPIQSSPRPLPAHPAKPALRSAVDDPAGCLAPRWPGGHVYFLCPQPWPMGPGKRSRGLNWILFCDASRPPASPSNRLGGILKRIGFSSSEVLQIPGPSAL